MGFLSGEKAEVEVVGVGLRGRVAVMTAMFSVDGRGFVCCA